MLPLSYTLSSDLRESLRIIDALRVKILTTPLSVTEEITRRWDAKINQIQGSLALANIKLTRHDIETHLSLQHKAKPSVVISYKNALDLIEVTWVASANPITQATFQTLADTIYVGPLLKHRRLNGPALTSIRKLCAYLENQTEHAIIRAGVALGMLSSTILPPDDPGLAARLVTLAYLAKEGYTLRGMVALERQWADEAPSYHLAISTISTQGNLNHWLLFFAQSVEAHYTKIATHGHVGSSSQQVKIPILNDRQHAIMHLLDDPTRTITNKTIQKRFRISQVTASRDLSKLMTLGILVAHGKGRSVSYTRI